MFRRSNRIVAASVLVFSLVFFTAAPSAHAATINDAFGDSGAAGLGLAPLPNPTANDTACGRSSQAYSALAAAQAGAINQNFACSGNVTKDVYDQLTAAKNYPAPQYVTLTIGANDINWGGLMNICMAQANCGGSAVQAQFNASLAAFKPNLSALLKSINSQFAPHQILLTGYYNIFGTDTSCGAPYGITSAEAATINGWMLSLRTAISSVAQTISNATFVPVSFNGVGICTANGPIQTPADPAWGHPTLLGSQIIANAVLSKVN